MRSILFWSERALKQAFCRRLPFSFRFRSGLVSSAHKKSPDMRGNAAVTRRQSSDVRFLDHST